MKISIKKNNSVLMSIFILLTVIFLTGCQGSGTTEKYRIGTEGLNLEFASSNVKSVYENENFGTSIIIKNIGSYDILDQSNPAILKVSFDDYRLKFTNSKENVKEQQMLINGKSKYYPKGDEINSEYYFESLKLTDLREKSTTEINYNLCYPYNTEITTVTCIDTKLANKDQTAAACASETYSGSQGQGAPIVITKIVPEIMLQTEYVRPQFKIYIENKGPGYVNNANSCNVADINDRSSSGRVNVYATLSGTPLECGPDNSASLKLVDSESFIRCYLPNKEKGYSRLEKNYLTPLTVSIDYTYTVITKQEIEIKRDDTIERVVTKDCDSYQILNENKTCVDKCLYCTTHPNEDVCKVNLPFAEFEFKEGFSCSCTLDQCNSRNKTGNCIKGYCPGSLYCCNTPVVCDKYQIEFKGKCINKCDYCRDNWTTNPNDPICLSKYDFTNAKCDSITATTCDSLAKNNSCIKGFCGGTDSNKYCVNTFPQV